MRRPLQMAVLLLFSLVIGYFQVRDGWVPLLDWANLVFHEAGHPLFGLMGETMGLYGGTLMQLLMPLAAVLHFWRQGAPFSTAACSLWLFENFFNIARYAADATARRLPVGMIGILLTLLWYRRRTAAV